MARKNTPRWSQLPSKAEFKLRERAEYRHHPFVMLFNRHNPTYLTRLLDKATIKNEAGIAPCDLQLMECNYACTKQTQRTFESY